MVNKSYGKYYTIEVLISKALIDSYIVSVNNMLRYIIRLKKKSKFLKTKTILLEELEKID